MLKTYSGALIIIPAIINIFVMIYIGYRRLPQIEKLLDRCHLIQDYSKCLSKTGIIGRHLRQAMIWQAYISREKWHRDGDVDKQQLEALPRNLKLWILIPNTVESILAAALVIWGLKYGVWDKYF